MSLPSNSEKVNTCANFFTTVQRPFPKIEDGKINTQEFIDAARGVVSLVEKLGSVFSPVKYDMHGNIEKILKRYEMDNVKNVTLMDMVLTEQNEGKNMATDALLWLTRALHFIELFLEQILAEATENSSETIKNELSHAYSMSVKPFHGWMTQKLFVLVIQMSPTRFQLFSSLEVSDTESFFRDLNVFVQMLRANRTEIQRFYAIHKLDPNTVV